MCLLKSASGNERLQLVFSRVVITLLLRALADLYELRGVAIPPATMAGITTFLPKIMKSFFLTKILKYNLTLKALMQELKLMKWSWISLIILAKSFTIFGQLQKNDHSAATQLNSWAQAAQLWSSMNVKVIYATRWSLKTSRERPRSKKLLAISVFL